MRILHAQLKLISLVILASLSPALSAGPLEDNAARIKAQAEQGDAKAQSHLGYLYYVGEGVPQDYGKAVEWYRKAATQGDKDAQYNLAVAYAFGEGVKQDLKEASIWYRRSAEQGHVISQYSLGLSYAYGEGVPQDSAEAVRWFKQAAEQGYVRAQVQLGSAYHTGEGVEQDYAQAIHWYRMAADRGDATAQYNLGALYRSGKGVEQNYQQAIRWFTMAADQGYAAAQNELASMQRSAGNVATRPTPQMRPGSADTTPGVSAAPADSSSVVTATETSSPIATEATAVASAPATDADSEAGTGETVAVSQKPLAASSLKSADGIGQPVASTAAPEQDENAGKGGLFGALGSLFQSRDEPARIEVEAVPDVEINTAAAPAPVREQTVVEDKVEVIANMPQTDTIVRAAPDDEMALEFNAADADNTETGAASDGTAISGAVMTQSVATDDTDEDSEEEGFFSRLFGSSKKPAEETQPETLALAQPAPEVSTTTTTRGDAQDYSVSSGRQALTAGDYEKAVAQFRPLAEAGDAEAQSHLASMYYVGRAVDKDYKQAFDWYRRAAEQGHVDSQYSIGNMYLLGEGVQQSNNLAALWYSKAAQQGHVAAENNLNSLKRMVEHSGDTLNFEQETEVAALSPSPAPPPEPVVVATIPVSDEAAEPAVPVTTNMPETDAIVRAVDTAEMDTANIAETPDATGAPAEAISEDEDSGGIGGFFSRLFGATDETPDIVEQGTVSENAEANLAATDQSSAQTEETQVRAFGIESAPVSEPLSSGLATSDAGDVTPPVEVAEPENIDTVVAADPVAQPSVEPGTTADSRPGFFEKLFGPASTPQATADQDEPPVESPAATDEAAVLAMNEPAGGTEPVTENDHAEVDLTRTEASPAATQEDSGKGFFARLFGGSDTEDTAPAEMPAEDPVALAADEVLDEAPVTPDDASGDNAQAGTGEEQFEFFDSMFAAGESEDEPQAAPGDDSVGNDPEIAMAMPEAAPISETPVEYITEFGSEDATADAGQIRPLAVQGDTGAQLQLADMYYQGQGLKQDYTQAFLWYRRAAQQGNVDAQYKLGNIYLMGEGVTQDDQQAALWYEKAASQGHDAARHNYENLQRLSAAQTVASMEETAVPVSSVTPSLAPGQGQSIARQNSVGDEVDDELPAVEPNGAATSEEKGFWESAGEFLGFKDEERATAAAGANTVEVEDELDDEMPKRVVAAAPAPASGATDTEALYERGMAHAFGDGVRKDYEKAAAYFQQAAAQGHAGAQYRLGIAYAYGEGVKRDEASSIEWYRRAAQQGHTTAQRTLAAMYLDGKGVPRDKVMAHAWYRIVADSGNVMDIRRRDMLQEELSEPELSESERIASEINSRLHNL